MVSDPGSLGMDLVKGKKLIRKEKIELDPVRIERKEIQRGFEFDSDYPKEH